MVEILGEGTGGFVAGKFYFRVSWAFWGLRGLAERGAYWTKHAYKQAQDALRDKLADWAAGALQQRQNLREVTA